MSDLISRQAAIGAIEEVEWYHQNKNKDMVSGANSSEHQAWYKADDIYNTLDALPSADAIPIEWLIKVMDAVNDAQNYADYETLNWLLNEWKDNKECFM